MVFCVGTSFSQFFRPVLGISAPEEIVAAPEMPIISSNSQESSESQESEMILVIVDMGKLRPGSVQ